MKFVIIGLKKSIELFAQNNGVHYTFVNNGRKTVCVTINLPTTVSGKTFSDVLYYFYQTKGEEVYSALSKFVTDRFYIVKGRNILFLNDCVTNEIKQHILGYWWSEGKNASAPILFRIYGVTESLYNDEQKKSKEIIAGHCRKIEIAETDVYDIVMSTGFQYFSGIRSEYKNTKYDPYFDGKKRVLTPRSDWVMY